MGEGRRDEKVASTKKKTQFKDCSVKASQTPFEIKTARNK